MLQGFGMAADIASNGGAVHKADIGREYRRARVRRVGRARARDPRRVLADAMEAEVKQRLIERGYFVTGTRHKEHFDLLVNGLRVEVKAAMFKSGRYGAALRASDADVLVLGCVADDVRFFVIPFDQVRGLRYFKISSHNPQAYQGRFAEFLDAWHVIDRLEQSGVNHWQMSLF